MDRGKDRADHAERSGAQIHKVAVALEERLGFVVAAKISGGIPQPAPAGSNRRYRQDQRQHGE
jgi:hypothetical protein